MGAEQANILKAMMHHHQPGPGGKKVSFGGLPQRPKTAATSSVYDEKRIKDKLKYLDNVFDKLDNELDKGVSNIDIDFFTGKAVTNKDDNRNKEGVKLTRAIVLSNSLLCDDLSEVTTLMLRDKNIAVFDDNIEDKDEEGNRFKVADMCNLECLMASHNLISEMSGVLQLTTLVELNLSYNSISFIS